MDGDHSKTTGNSEIEKFCNPQVPGGATWGCPGRVPGAHEGPKSRVLANFQASYLWGSEGKALEGGEECSSHRAVIPGIYVYL